MSLSEAQRVLQQQYHDQLAKYLYFLLAATGAGIGFIVQKLEGQRFDVEGSLIVACAAMWLLSFLLGCLALDREIKAKKANIHILQFKDGTFAGMSKNDPDRQEKESAAWGRFIAATDHARAFIAWQFRTLLLGAFLMILSRVVGMAALS